MKEKQNVGGYQLQEGVGKRGGRGVLKAAQSELRLVGSTLKLEEGSRCRFVTSVGAQATSPHCR